MAKTKGRLFDRNRLVKRYPYVRSPKKNVFVGDKNIEMEVISVSFSNESSKEVKFEHPFLGTDYQVVLTPRQSSDADSASVNLTVDPNGRDQNGFTIRASAPFTGHAEVMVVRIS